MLLVSCSLRSSHLCPCFHCLIKIKHVFSRGGSGLWMYIMCFSLVLGSQVYSLTSCQLSFNMRLSFLRMCDEGLGVDPMTSFLSERQASNLIDLCISRVTDEGGRDFHGVMEEIYVMREILTSSFHSDFSPFKIIVKGFNPRLFDPSL